MKKDEWELTKELGKLRKYGFMLQAKRVNENEKNYRYNIIYEKSKKILEPECSVEEIIGIINVVEQCLERIKKYNEEKEYEKNCS